MLVTGARPACAGRGPRKILPAAARAARYTSSSPNRDRPRAARSAASKRREAAIRRRGGRWPLAARGQQRTPADCHLMNLAADDSEGPDAPQRERNRFVLLRCVSPVLGTKRRIDCNAAIRSQSGRSGLRASELLLMLKIFFWLGKRAGCSHWQSARPNGSPTNRAPLLPNTLFTGGFATDFATERLGAVGDWNGWATLGRSKTIDGTGDSGINRVRPRRER